MFSGAQLQAVESRETVLYAETDSFHSHAASQKITKPMRIALTRYFSLKNIDRPLELSRLQLCRSHPEADLDRTQREVRRSAPDQRMIEVVQERLESLALDHAVIADCKPRTEASVSNCGLYFYKRDKGAVFASTQRIFSVPIEDPSLWADALAEKLYAGLEASRQIEMNALIDEFVNQRRTTPVDDSSPLFVAVQAGLARLGTNTLASLPTSQIQFGLGNYGHRISLNLLASSGSTPAAGRGVLSAHEFGIGPAFSLRARALTSIVWGLNFQGTWIRSELAQSTGGMKLTQDSLVVSTGPSLSVEISRNFQTDFSYGFEYASSYRSRESFEQGSGFSASFRSKRQRILLGMVYLWDPN